MPSTRKVTKTSKATKSSKATETSSIRKDLLLRMPQEIQDMIYKYAITEDKPINIRLRAKLRHLLYDPRILCIDRPDNKSFTIEVLAFTNTKIANTVLLNEMFWRENEFTFPSIRDMYRFLRRLSPRQAAAVRSVSAPWCYFKEDTGRYFKLISEKCTGLQELKLDIRGLERYLITDDRFSRDKFEATRGVQELKSLRGLKKFELRHKKRPDMKCLFEEKPADFDEEKLGDYSVWAYGEWRKELKELEKETKEIVTKRK